MDVEPIVQTVHESLGEACEAGDHRTGEALARAATLGEDIRRQLRLWARQEACRSRKAVQRRIIGYRVTYRFGGRLATTRLSYDPGHRIPVDVSLSPLP